MQRILVLVRVSDIGFLGRPADTSGTRWPQDTRLSESMACAKNATISPLDSIGGPASSIHCCLIAIITVHHHEAASFDPIPLVGRVHILFSADLLPRHAEHRAAARLQ